jgi:hypothetical protein
MSDVLARLSARSGEWLTASDVRGEDDFNIVQHELAALGKKGAIESRRISPGRIAYKVGALAKGVHYSELLPEPWKWTPERGGPMALPGWYRNFVGGSKWFAGCRWLTGGVPLEPAAIEGSAESMPWPRLYAEALNIIEGEQPWAQQLGRALLGATLTVEPSSGRRGVEALIDEARSRCAQFVAPWCIDAFLDSAHFTIPFRTGWGFSNDEIRQRQNNRRVRGFIGE